MELLVNCGALFGLKVPKTGPLAGVPVHWRAEAKYKRGFQDLVQQGTLTYSNETDRDGYSELQFRPDNEVISGVGPLRTADGTLEPTVDVLSAFGNKTAWITEHFLAPRYLTYLWSVERHKARGFKFEARFDANYHADFPRIGRFDGTRIFALDGHVCGENPYEKPWTIDDLEIDRFPMSERSGTFSTQVQLGPNGNGKWTGSASPGAPWMVHPTKGNVDVYDTAELQFLPSPQPPPKMKVVFTFIRPEPPAVLDTASPQTDTVPVVEDTSCPAD